MFLERACKKYRKEEKVHRNLMADQTRFPARGVHKKHKKSGQLHPNLVCGQARFSLTEGNNNAAKDLASELPEEILCYILSFLPFREAVRTSVLARKWRGLWRFILNLNFDVNNMTGNDYQSNTSLLNHLAGKSDGKKEDEHSFVVWVNQFLELHAGGKIKSCNIDYPLGAWVSDTVDHWIQILLAKGIEKLHMRLACVSHYEFPFRLFAHVQRFSSLRCLALEHCTFDPPHNFICLGNLISLSLGWTLLTQETIDDIFKNCTKLESFSASFCGFHGSQLIIGSNCDHLELKHLNISFCCYPQMIEICQATSLSSLEYRGMNLHDLCFKNSANPVKLFFDILGAEAADIYHLSKTLTQVKTLSLCLRNRKGFEVPNLVPIFAKLEKLVLLMADVDPKLMLEFILSLLKASPLLHRLELHLPSLSKKNRKLQMKSTLERLFQHKCLKKVKIFNFQGAPVELQLVRYLLKSATGVDSMTIVRREQLYEGDGKWRGSQFEPGVTRKQVLTRLVGHLPFFTRLTVL